MENIRSSPEVNETSSSTSPGAASSSEEASMAGKLEGVKITEAEHERNFSSPNSASHEEGFLEERKSDEQLHSFIQAHPSTATLATDSTLPTDPSPSLTEEESPDLRGIKERSYLFQQKIAVEEKVSYPSSQEGWRELNQCQQHYIKNLHDILRAMDDVIAIHEPPSDAIPKIESAVDEMVMITQDIKKYKEELIADNIAGKKRSYTGATGEASESLLHYHDYIQCLELGNEKQAAIDFCLGKKCWAKFKFLEAQEKENQKEKELFRRACSCYTRALEENSFGGGKFEEVGDSFFSAAIMEQNQQQELSKLYEQAACCREMLLSDFKNEEVSLLLELRAGCYGKAVSEFQKNNQELVRFYKLAGDFIGAALKTQQRVVFQQWKEAAECYLDLIEEQKKDLESDSPVLQLLKSAAQYGEIAAKIIEENPDQDEQITSSLIGSALNLRLAAKALQNRDEELSEAYQNCAASYHSIVMVSNADLIERFPLKFQMQFKKGSVANSDLLDYWSRIAIENYKELEKLLDAREGNKEKPASNETSAI